MRTATFLFFAVVVGCSPRGPAAPELVGVWRFDVDDTRTFNPRADQSSVACTIQFYKHSQITYAADGTVILDDDWRWEGLEDRQVYSVERLDGGTLIVTLLDERSTMVTKRGYHVDGDRLTWLEEPTRGHFVCYRRVDD